MNLLNIFLCLTIIFFVTAACSQEECDLCLNNPCCCCVSDKIESLKKKKIQTFLKLMIKKRNIDFVIYLFDQFDQNPQLIEKINDLFYSSQEAGSSKANMIHVRTMSGYSGRLYW